VRLSAKAPHASVTFPDGTSHHVHYHQLVEYAKKFAWLDHKFNLLAQGKSKRVWTLFLTNAPVLSLGTVGAAGPITPQIEACSQHLMRHQIK